MKWELESGRVINIPDEEISKLMESLKIEEGEAIELYLSDNGFEENAEQTELDKTAKKVRVNHGAVGDKKTEKKPRTVKISDEKKKLFTYLCEDLFQMYGRNVEILKENKLIQVKIGEKIFKVDLIEQRTPKK